MRVGGSFQAANHRGERKTASVENIWCEKISGCSYRAVKLVTVPIRANMARRVFRATSSLFLSRERNLASRSDPLDASLQKDRGWIIR
jgi:hypothetical protein